MHIRLSLPEDMERIMEIYQISRTFMRENGNPNQWAGVYPDKATILQDIALKQSYVCLEGEEIVAVFCFFKGNDPTYTIIESGDWLNNGPYAVIHRIASGGTRAGAASFCMDWCFQQHANLRIDTHEDNLPMQKAVLKNGFQYCGIIHIADGSPRLAYQRGAQGGTAPLTPASGIKSLKHP